MLTIRESIDILKAAGFSVYKHTSKNKWFVQANGGSKCFYTLGLIEMAQSTEDYIVEKLSCTYSF